MSFYEPHLRELIQETLSPIGLWSKQAEELLLGTCAQESHFGKYLKQISGPALGIFQIEPATEKDIWENYLKFRPQLIKAIKNSCRVTSYGTLSLKSDLKYQIIMARIHYRRVSSPLPLCGDIDGQASYWDNHFNCNPDKGFPSEYIKNYRKFVKKS